MADESNVGNDNKFNITTMDLPQFDPQVEGALYLKNGDVRVSQKGNNKWSKGARFVPLAPGAIAAFTGDNGDWTVDYGAGQMYVFSENTGSMEPIGSSLTTVQALIDGSFSGGDTTLLTTNTSVPADGTAGVSDPTGQVAGWYYKNTANVADKINWYYLANTNPALTMTKANLDGMYAVVTVRASGAPFFVVYTKPTGSGDAAPWYKSRYVYSPAGLDLSAYVGQTIFLYWGNDPGDFISLPRVECTLDTFSSNGPQDPAEEILFGNISTSTGYGAGTYEFVISELAFDYNSNVFGYDLAAPSGAAAPATLDDAYIALDGVNDFISLTGTGSTLDYTATWTIGLEIVDLPSNTTDSTFWCFARSGNNGLALRKGGTNWGFYAAQNQYSVAQANTWVAPSAGSRILVECDGVRLKYWLDGVQRSNTVMNTTYRDGTDHVVNSLEIGKGGIPFAQGTFRYAEGGFDNLIVTYNILSAAEKAEFFAGGDVTTHSYYSAARDAVPFGEGTFPNVTGEKSNITGSLVNGTSDDFVERV